MISQIGIVLFDGFAFGMLLFLLSVGLSVTLGMMNFINLAHGAFGMFGGYVAVTVMRQLGLPFLAALPLAFIAMALLSVLIERTLFRRLYKSGELNQVLFTIGLVFVAAAVATFTFGTVQQVIILPDWLRGSVEVFGLRLGVYRSFIIVVALLVTGLLVFGLERTRLGAQIRAAVETSAWRRGWGSMSRRSLPLPSRWVRAWLGWAGRWRSRLWGSRPPSASRCWSMC
jgi:branched-chain amino acid transport system permease protein